jgi:hypothetical protein
MSIILATAKRLGEIERQTVRATGLERAALESRVRAGERLLGRLTRAALRNPAVDASALRVEIAVLRIL